MDVYVVVVVHYFNFVSQVTNSHNYYIVLALLYGHWVSLHIFYFHFVPVAGCKESYFYSLPFRQAEASIY